MKKISVSGYFAVVTRIWRSPMVRWVFKDDENMKNSPNDSVDVSVDINRVFDNILLSEERISEEGYKQGFEKGVSEGNLDAYHLGK